MTKKTRLFLTISAGVLVLGLGTGLLASYMGVQTLTIIGADGPDELAYLPQDSRLVAFANVRDVMDSGIRRTLEQLQPGRQERNGEFQAATGIDFETDVDAVVASLGAGDGPDAERMLVLARGRFDEVRIEGLIRERGGDAGDYKGKRLLTVPGGNGVDEDRPFAVAFVEPGLVAFGPATAVRRAIDTKAGTGGNVTANRELMDIIRDIDDGNAWAVGRFDAMARSGRIPQGVAGQLPPITWVAGSGHINDGVEGLIRAETSSDQAANDLREVIRGFVALARLQTRQNLELGALLNSLQLGGEGRTVSVGFSVPADAVPALAAMRRVPEPRGPRPETTP